MAVDSAGAVAIRGRPRHARDMEQPFLGLGVLALAGLVLGCTSRAASRPETSSPTPSTPAAERRLPSTAIRFWTSEEGLQAYDFEGQPVARQGSVGKEVRRLPDGRFVAFSDAHGTTPSVAMLTASGEEELRIPLPNGFDPESCQAGLTAVDDAQDEPHLPLTLQTPQAFGVDLERGYACLELLDRNENMASRGLSIAVNLQSGAVEAFVSLDIDGRCKPEGPRSAAPCASFSMGEPWVEGSASPPEPETWPFDVDETRSWIVKDGEPYRSLCRDGGTLDGDSPCAEVESRSPTGRFIQLRGDGESSDYIYSEVVLFDRRTGELWQIHEASPKSPAFVVVEPDHLFTRERFGSILTVIGESDYGWLPLDRFWVDGTLLIPERRVVVRVGGRRVRFVTSTD